MDELLYWSGRRLTLDECLRDDLTPHRLTPTWITHDKFVYQADDGSLTLLDTSNNSVSLLVSNHTLVRITRRSHWGRLNFESTLECTPLNCTKDFILTHSRRVSVFSLAKMSRGTRFFYLFRFLLCHLFAIYFYFQYFRIAKF